MALKSGMMLLRNHKNFNGGISTLGGAEGRLY